MTVSNAECHIQALNAECKANHFMFTLISILTLQNLFFTPTLLFISGKLGAYMSGLIPAHGTLA